MDIFNLFCGVAIIPEVPVVDAPYAPAVPVVEVAAGIPAAVYGPRKFISN